MGAVGFLLSNERNELSRPGFESGFLRPQRNVLTTKRSNVLTTRRYGPVFHVCVLKTFLSLICMRVKKQFLSLIFDMVNDSSFVSSWIWRNVFEHWFL